MKNFKNLNNLHKPSLEMAPSVAEEICVNKMKNTISYWRDFFGIYARKDASIFAKIEDNKLCRVEAKDTVSELIKWSLIENVKQVCLLQFKVFTFVLFDNEENAAMFAEKMNSINGCEVIHIVPDKDSKIELLINDIPPIVIKENIVEVLNETCEVIEILPNVISLSEKVKVETTPTKVMIKLKGKKTIEDIPQFFVKGKTKSIISIKGRPNPCFNCGGRDHRAKECKFVFCPRCHMLVAGETHNCINLYANRVKKGINSFEGMLAQAVRQVEGGGGQVLLDSSVNVIEDCGAVKVNDKKDNIEKSDLINQSKEGEIRFKLFDNFEFPDSPVVDSDVEKMEGNENFLKEEDEVVSEDGSDSASSISGDNMEEYMEVSSVGEGLKKRKRSRRSKGEQKIKK